MLCCGIKKDRVFDREKAADYRVNSQRFAGKNRSEKDAVGLR